MGVANFVVLLLSDNFSEMEISLISSFVRKRKQLGITLIVLVIGDQINSDVTGLFVKSELNTNFQEKCQLQLSIYYLKF